MARCPSCGDWNEDDASYCRRCGHRLDSRRAMGLNRLLYDTGAQTLWIKRVIAYAIDSFIVSAVGALLALMAYLPLWVGSLFSGDFEWTGIWRLPFILGAGQVLYFTLMEYMYGASLGKQFLGLRVEAYNGGRPSLVAAFMRNVSKIHGLILLIDVALGLTMTEYTKDKFTDGVAGAYVVGGDSWPLYRGIRIQRPIIHSFDGEWIDLDELGERDILDGVGFGVFLLVIATIALNYPGVHHVLFNWVQGWGASGLTPVPGELLPPLYWFFTSMGTWSMISAVIRYFSRWNIGRAAQDLVGGMFNFYMVYLIQRYDTAAFAWGVLFPTFIVFIGAQILLSVFLHPYTQRR